MQRPLFINMGAMRLVVDTQPETIDYPAMGTIWYAAVNSDSDGQLTQVGTIYVHDLDMDEMDEYAETDRINVNWGNDHEADFVDLRDQVAEFDVQHLTYAKADILAHIDSIETFFLI
jgi:hypothetical protein